MASQPLFDKYDRVVGSTLSAPTSSETFVYNPLFFTSSNSSSAYSWQNFDSPATQWNPTPAAQSQPGTLGWYYSTNNTLEPYTAATAYPYSRQLSQDDASSTTSVGGAPDDALRLGKGHEVVTSSFPARNELMQYLQLRAHYIGSETDVSPTARYGMATVQVSQDADGKKVVAVQDDQQRTLWSGRPGGDWLNVTNKVKVACPYWLEKTEGSNLKIASTEWVNIYDEAGSLVYRGIGADFVDATGGANLKIIAQHPFQVSYTVTSWTGIFPPYIQIDTNVVKESQGRVVPQFFNFAVFGPNSVNIQPLLAGSRYKILNTVTGSDVTDIYKTRPQEFGAGFYKLLIEEGAVELSYANSYQDISFNFYNRKGQLIASVAPNGVQQLLTSAHPTDPGWITPATTPLEAVEGGAVTPGSALQFDGVDDRIAFQASNTLPVNTFTVEAWVWPTAAHEIDNQANSGYDGTRNQRYLIFPDNGGQWGADDAGMGLSVGTNGVSVYEHGAYYIPPVLVWAGNLSGWTHIAVTYDGTYGKAIPVLYINGKMVATGLTSGKERVRPSYNIGGGAYGYYQGQADELRIWSTARTAEQIAASYKKGFVQLPSELRCYWRLDEGAGTRVYDQHADQRTGTLTNFASATSWTYPDLASLPFCTRMEYDLQGRITAQTETDAGRTEYVYRADGQIRFSQNAKQRASGAFSYTGYDLIGRVVESGECVPNDNNSFFSGIKTSSYIESKEYGGSGLPGYYTRREIVRITYDAVYTSSDGPVPPAHNLSGYTSSFTTGRIATVVKYASGLPYGGYQRVSQTWFSYDEQGRSTWVIQQANGLPAKSLDYTYDAAGNVKTVCFQKNQVAERFTHYYTYDADQRLSKVETGLDDPANQTSPHTEQARYDYYLHGPLKRVVYGGDLQGVDYTYTTQGWLKAINAPRPNEDPGQDGRTNNLLPDLFSQEQDYFAGDYYAAARLATTNPTNQPQQFNGNIVRQAWRTSRLPTMQGYAFQYDDRGQLSRADYGQVQSPQPGQLLFTTDAAGRYAETNLEYDPNGNLNRLRRTDGVGWAMMDIKYDYRGSNSVATANKLLAVKQAGTNQDVIKYTYDALGQTVAQEEATGNKYLDYDVTGKVTAVYRDAAKQQPLARYTYNDAGKRMLEERFGQNASQPQKFYYAYDAAGSELATYRLEPNSQQWVLVEQPVYGSSRLGTYRRAQQPATSQPDGPIGFPGQQQPVEVSQGLGDAAEVATAEDQLYELHDQLGNVRAVFHRPVKKDWVLTMEAGREEQEIQDFATPDDGGETYNAVRQASIAFPSKYGANYSVRLDGNQLLSPGKTVAVEKGDKLTISVWAYYPGYDQPVEYSKGALVGALAGSVGTTTVKGLPTSENKPPSKTSQLLSRLSLGVALPLSQKAVALIPINFPRAALQAVARRTDGNFLSNATVSVTSEAQGQWKQYQLEVTAEEDGSIEVSLASYNGVTIYFDDLKIVHTPNALLEESHFYVYGQRNDGLSWTSQYLQNFRRGYQGEFSKFDKETGYNSFDLRMYDARVGRWISVDPKRQFASPYIGMGNNPIMNLDKDGGEANDIIFKNKKGTEIGRIILPGKDQIVDVNTFRDDINITIDPSSLAKELGVSLDKISAVGFGITASASGFGGANVGLEFVYFRNGPDQGKLFSYVYAGPNVGLEASAGVYGFGATKLIGKPTGNSWTGWFSGLSGGVGAAGGGIFWSNTLDKPELKPTQLAPTVWLGTSITVSASGGGKVGGKWSSSYYWQLGSKQVSQPSPHSTN